MLPEIMSRIDLRKLALTAAILSGLCIVMPAWNFAKTMISLSGNNPHLIWLAVAESALLLPLAVVTPLFYFALFRRGQGLRVPQHLAVLRVAGIYIFGLFIAAGLPQAGRALRSDWGAVRMSHLDRGGSAFSRVAWDRRTVDALSVVVNQIANLVQMAVLIILPGKAKEEAVLDVPRSDLLRVAADANLIFLGSATLFVTPYVVYRSLQFTRLPETH